ncbi:MAG: 30S ribosomal protein S4 [Candidatus Pacebacteria bacterium]|nr:30S ribosomal protein S4 [Candidatus Paceibacterota bacterium]
MLQITSKYRIAKRLGAAIFEKTQSQKFSLAEARALKNGKRRRPLSDFGKQLLEKQKSRFTYGLLEHQFARYVGKAMDEGQPAAALHRMLETRLDSVAYRLGLASTRRAARQIVTHGHLTVNGKRMNVPSHSLRIGDVIGVREGSKTSALFAGIAEKEQHNPPSWLTFDPATLKGTVTALPTYVPGEGAADYAQVIEFYSR